MYNRPLSHSVHLKGQTPVCVFMCLLNLYLSAVPYSCKRDIPPFLQLTWTRHQCGEYEAYVSTSHYDRQKSTSNNQTE